VMLPDATCANAHGVGIATARATKKARNVGTDIPATVASRRIVKQFDLNRFE